MKPFLRNFSVRIPLCFLIGAVGTVYGQEVARPDSLIHSNRSGIENTLQGVIPGLRVKSWSGTGGIQSVLNLRGLSLDPTDESTQPLIMINGVQVIANPSKITGINPLGYYSPEQVEKIEVLKSIDALAAYGVQAPNGAINIIMKEGHIGPLHVRASASAGINYLDDMDFRKDAFYGFNTIARRETYGQGGIVHEQNLMVDGGGDYGSYLFGLNNYQDKGIIKSSNFGRQSLFLNAKYNISPKLTAHFYNNLALAARDGRYAGEHNRNMTLPVVADEAAYMDKKRNIAFLTSVLLSYKLSDDWTLNSQAGLSYEGSARDMYIPSNILVGNIYSSSEAYKRQLIHINTYLRWKKAFSDDLRLDLRLGNEIRTIDHRLTTVDGSRTMESGGSDFVKVVTGYNANQVQALSDHEQERLVGFYGNGQLRLQDRLQLSMVLRTDGSSLYRNKWAFYPAVGASYKLSDMGTPITFKLAAGKTGMLNRPEVYRGELYPKGEYYNANELGVGDLYRPFPGAKSVSVYQFDLGAQLEFSPRISLSLEYFQKSYCDFLVKRYLPNIHDTDYGYELGGKISLSGLESRLYGNWVQSERLSWTSDLNLAFYTNKIKELPRDVASTSLQHWTPLSKGDAVTSLIAYEGGREKVIGNSAPRLFGGITNRLSYDALSLAFTFDYASAYDIVTESFSSRYRVSDVGAAYPLKQTETPYYFLTGNDPLRVYQGIRTMENGAFVRLARAELAYHLGDGLKNSLSLDRLTLFLRGENLLLLSKYSGFNPEENVTGVRRADLSLTGTPLPATVVLGLKLVL